MGLVGPVSTITSLLVTPYNYQQHYWEVKLQEDEDMEANSSTYTYLSRYQLPFRAPFFLPILCASSRRKVQERKDVSPQKKTAQEEGTVLNDVLCVDSRFADATLVFEVSFQRCMYLRMGGWMCAHMCATYSLSRHTYSYKCMLEA